MYLSDSNVFLTLGSCEVDLSGSGVLLSLGGSDVYVSPSLLDTKGRRECLLSLYECEGSFAFMCAIHSERALRSMRSSVSLRGWSARPC